MQTLIFSTGSIEKFDMARRVCVQHGINLQQRTPDIDEIQAEDSEYIIRNKAKKAFAEIQLPLVVSDDSWDIPGLRGFPGPYMKSINHWFSPEDLLRLTADLTDRSVYLVQRLAYIDARGIELFELRIRGEVQREARGEYGLTSSKLIAMDGDNGLTISEIYDKGLNTNKRANTGAWRQLAEWFVAH